MDQQAITWCAALEWRPGEDHTLERPAAYEFWRNYRADFWPGPQLGWTTQEPETSLPLSRPAVRPVRRARPVDLSSDSDMAADYADQIRDVTVLNWPQVDYWLTPLIGVPAAERGGVGWPRM